MVSVTVYLQNKIGGALRPYKNAVLPVKTEELLDEQLDSAVLSVSRIKTSKFPLFGNARVNIQTVSKSGEKTLRTTDYYIADDNAHETPVGSGFYTHELTLIERTKLLENFQLPSLCFSNSSESFTKANPPDLITSQGFTDIDGYPSNYGTPVPIGTEYKLLPLDKSKTSGLTLLFPYYSNAAVYVYNNAGALIKRVSIGNLGEFDDGQDTTFTIGEGANRIVYSYIYRQTESTSYEHIDEFTIYGVENRKELLPYTIQAVIERVLELAEPLRKGKLPRFKLFIPSGKTELFEQFAPEFTLTRSTLREALQTVGGFIHAEPRLIDDNLIAFSFYGENNLATVTDHKDGTIKPLNEVSYTTLQNKHNLDETVNAFDSYQDNLVNRTGYGVGNVNNPVTGGYVSLRMDSVWIRADESNSNHIPSTLPIDKIQRVSMIYDGGALADITPYIYDKAVYDNLSGITTTFPSSKAFALYFTQGSKGIYGLFYKNPTPWSSGVGANYSIVNIYNAVFLKTVTSLDYSKLWFNLVYTPIYSTRVQQTKSYIGDFLPLPRTVNYTQSDNSVEAQYFGEHIKGAVERTGNVEKSIVIHLSMVDNLPKCGQLYDDDTYISSVTTAVLPDHLAATVGLSKRFNRKSKYIGANSIRRIYEVSEEQVQERHTMMTDYIVITLDNPADIPAAEFTDEGLFLGESALNAIQAQFTVDTGVGMAYLAPYGVLARGYTHNGSEQENVILPVVSSAFGNAVEFTWAYKDNFSAGERIETATADGVTGRFTVEQEYADFYGRFYFYEFAIAAFSASVNAADRTQEQADGYPLYDWYVTGDKLIASATDSNGGQLTVRKDGRETLKFTYALNFVTDNQQIIIGSALTGRNPMVNARSETPHLYALKTPLNRFSSYIDLSEAYDLGAVAVEDITVDTAAKTISFAGKRTRRGVTYVGWAYAYPQTDGETREYENEYGETVEKTLVNRAELLFGQNVPVEPLTVVGRSYAVAVHDIYGYLRYFSNKKNK